MKHSYHFLRYDPHGIKNKLYRFIDKIHSRSIKDFYPITYSYELNKNDYYLNLCNNKWCHPRYNNEIYTESFIDLYNNAVNNAVYMINKVNEVLFENKNIKILNDVFLNLSLTSGKECNDKAKNKYFEF